jgi:hypothetical protein
VARKRALKGEFVVMIGAGEVQKESKTSYPQDGVSRQSDAEDADTEESQR